ncbi:MAG: TetR/AcrR family transcriptional regulator [Bryobacterales bacterium]|nr:TetR/AcrR family transcriptional regulator [Bryobacterales bacterium]
MSATETTAKSTSQRILKTAEGLFATQGIRGTSLKEITELAEVNIAAVNYYFRSKDALARAVYRHCLQPLNEERLRLLDEAEAAAGGKALRLAQVLYALFEPMVRTWQTNRNFVLLIGRLQSEPDPQLNVFLQGLYGGMIERFLQAARRAAPEVGEPQLFFWIHFLFGGVVYTMINSQDMDRMHPGQNLIETSEQFLGDLISFGTAGLRSLSHSTRS